MVVKLGCYPVPWSFALIPFVTGSCTGPVSKTSSYSETDTEPITCTITLGVSSPMVMFLVCASFFLNVRSNLGKSLWMDATSATPADVALSRGGWLTAGPTVGLRLHEGFSPTCHRDASGWIIPQPATRCVRGMFAFQQQHYVYDVLPLRFSWVGGGRMATHQPLGAMGT